jgi:hypothetical protein
MVHMKVTALKFGWCAALAMLSATVSWAASPSSAKKDATPAKTVGLFEGMESGEVEAVMIQRDSTEGTIMLKNRSGQPLTVKLPPAFGGVPILAQIGGGGMGGGGMGGGGMGGGMGGMGGGMGGGMFNIAADKVRKIKIVTVCLDHGKDDPSPRVPYKPIPLESYAKSPAVGELVKLMLTGRIDQHSAQAATWHIQNGLSWEELARKIGVKHIDGRKEPYFTPAQLQRAFLAVEYAQEQVEKMKSEGSDSLSNKLGGE